MTQPLVYALSLVVSYLLGAMPFGYIVSKTRGVNIREVGSGNIGATNVFRSVGKPAGLVTFILDASKGFCSTFAIPLVAGRVAPGIWIELLALGCAASVVAGHNWPVYLRFKGGKGVATSAGAVLGIVPLALAIGVLVWILSLLLFRYVSVASMASAVAAALSTWLLYAHEGLVRPVALTCLCGVAIWRHKSNIERLLQGTEPRVGRKKKRSCAI
ncbi:MAG: glycerol-3-phosphate 1-O-acyltransferase PlsY [Verrucomicrobiota bacterium]